MSLKQIFEGWKNHLTPDSLLQESIKAVSEQRMAICKVCPFNSENAEGYKSFRTDEHCIECGCTLLPKTKCLSCSCPKDKWGPEVTPEEEKIIDDNEKAI